jgi:hypothetical protein
MTRKSIAGVTGWKMSWGTETGNKTTRDNEESADRAGCIELAEMFDS